MRLFLIIILFTLSMSAQPEIGGSGFSVPAAPNLNVAPSGTISGNKSIFDYKKPSSGSLDLTPQNKFGKQTEFANPGDVVVDRLNKKQPADSDSAIRENQYFGDVRTHAKKVNVRYRDHEYPDGDLIKIYVNDVVQKPSVLLEADFQSFELTLVDGFNKIDFFAINQGTSGPNTAEFEIFDEKGTLISSNRWNLGTGFRATVIVVKD